MELPCAVPFTAPLNPSTGFDVQQSALMLVVDAVSARQTSSTVPAVAASRLGGSNAVNAAATI